MDNINISDRSGTTGSADHEAILEQSKSDEKDVDMASDQRDQWAVTHHGSIDLDDKLTSMTGSYSEIIEESQEDNMKTPTEQRAFNEPDSPTTNRPTSDQIGEFLEHTSQDQIRDENIARFLRDISDKGSIGSGSSFKWKDSKVRHHGHTAQRVTQYPSCPPIDPSLIVDLEEHARGVASSMDSLIESLTGSLQSISALSVDCMETYRDAVCKTCDAVDANIKSMYQLMAKCEELSKTMKSVHTLHDQIKEIRRLLDLYESVVFSGGP